MTFPDVRSLAPLQVNSTVLAIEGLQVPPEIAMEHFRHSGGEFPSVTVLPGAAPRAQFRTPAKGAIDLFGLKGLPITTLDVYFAKFVDGIRSPDAVHTKYPLAASAKAFGWIRRISCQDRGIAWAECEIVYLSATGMAHPVGAAANSSLPSLPAQPALHTLAPTQVNAATHGGALGFTFDLNPDIMLGLEGNPGDGLLYHTLATYMGGAPTIEVDHGDPIALLGTLGQTGVVLGAQGFKQWLREFDAVNHVALPTGISFSIAQNAGRVVPVAYGADTGRVAKGGLRIEGLSAGATHPVVVGSGTVPTL